MGCLRSPLESPKANPPAVPERPSENPWEGRRPAFSGGFVDSDRRLAVRLVGDGPRRCSHRRSPRPRLPEPSWRREHVHELAEKLVADILDDAAPELRRFASDCQVGGDLDGRVRASRGDLRHDGRSGGAVTSLVLALGLHHDAATGLVTFEEGTGAAVQHGDRAQFHLDGTGESVAVTGDQARAGDAGHERLQVVEGVPRLVERNGEDEGVVESIRQPSPRAQRSGRRAWRAPMPGVAGNRRPR